MTGLDVTRQGRVMLLTIDDPPTRNALGLALMAGLRDAVEGASTDDEVGALVLTGAAGTFCSGGDLKWLDASRTVPREQMRDALEGFHGLIRAMRACPKPIIAAVEGAAAGAGFPVALACDLVVAAEDSIFALAYIKVGLTSDGGGSASLARSLPPQLAAEILFEGGRIGAERLAQLGLINRVTALGGALAEATAWAARLADGPTAALGRAKSLLEAAYGGMDAQLDREADAFVESLFHAEAGEGIAAFFDKRAPAFPKG
ncbi:oxepin-CoA hydrolase, alternative type [Azospirillum sp. sgz302134]